MSRRASFFARQHPGVRRVRFPDEIVFEESIKEADGEAIMAMLRRASVDIDVNRINMAGMTALHQVNNKYLIFACVFICIWEAKSTKLEGAQNFMLQLSYNSGGFLAA